jgi:hypothetical protein
MKIPRRQTGKSMQIKKYEVNWQLGHQVKRHDDGLVSDGWSHSLTSTSFCIVPIGWGIDWTDWYMRISATYFHSPNPPWCWRQRRYQKRFFNSALTRLIAREDFSQHNISAIVL